MAGDTALTTHKVVSSIIQQVSSVVPAEDRAQSPTNYGTHSGWTSPDSFITKLFAGEPTTIAFAFLVTLTLPVLLHFYFYTTSARTSNSDTSSDGIPTFLLMGPSGSGKTSLVTLLQRRAVTLTVAATGVESKSTSDNDDENSNPNITINGTGTGTSTGIKASSTRLSQIPTTVGMHLPPSTPLGSNKYRSENDFEVSAAKTQGAKYKIIDTPGHGKLRLEQALSYITRPGLGLKGVVFVVDSSAIDASAATDGGEVAKDTIGYLYDVLLTLQRRPKMVKKSKAEDVRILVACNKQDLFTSLPPGAVKARLEEGLERVKTSKRRGVVAVDKKEDGAEDEDETVLGGGGEEKISFKMLDEVFGIGVDVVGGAVKGDEDGRGVRKWEEWVGSCL